MHERVQLCQDPQTEFAILRESLRVSRINHILGVHGHTIFQEQEATQIFDVGQRSLQRLFPGFTEDSSEQATLSANQSGTGYNSAQDVAHPSTLGCSHCSQTAGSPHESRSSKSRTLARATSAGATGHVNGDGHRRVPRRPRRLGDPHSLTKPAKNLPKLQLIHGSKQHKDTPAQPSRAQQCRK